MLLLNLWSKQSNRKVLPQLPVFTGLPGFLTFRLSMTVQMRIVVASAMSLCWMIMTRVRYKDMTMDHHERDTGTTRCHFYDTSMFRTCEGLQVDRRHDKVSGLSWKMQTMCMMVSALQLLSFENICPFSLLVFRSPDPGSLYCLFQNQMKITKVEQNWLHSSEEKQIRCLSSS